MLHTSITAYANRNGILERLVALFLLLFTTSSDVVCLKFGGVWEMLWIYKVARWTCDRCTKINKSPTVSNGVGASSFEIWTANLAQSLTVGTLTNSWSFIFGDSNWKFCKVGYTVGTQKPDLQMQTFLIWDFFNLFFMLLFFQWKKSKPVGYTRTLYSQTGKNMKWAETFVWCLSLIFKVVYQDPLTQLLPFTRDFVANGQQLVWGQVG